MHILLLSRYGPRGSSSRVRMYQYLPYLRTQGFSFEVAPLLSDDYVRRLYSGEKAEVWQVAAGYWQRIMALLRTRQFDLVWVERELFPWMPAWAEGLLARSKTPYVAEFDDAVFHRYDLHRFGLVRGLLGKKIDRVMAHAAVVNAGNTYIAQRAQAAGAQRVEILPSVVDLARYGPAAEDKDKPFTIGWIGAPVTAPYLQMIQPALSQFCKTSGAVVHLVGAGNIDLVDVPVELVPWSEETEVQEIQQFDLGIMPVPDEPFERGKCGYKLIQYMACGVMVAASPVGVNAQIVENGVNGFLADLHDAWMHAFETAWRDPLRRKDMGAKGRTLVEHQYSLDITAPKLAGILSSII